MIIFAILLSGVVKCVTCVSFEFTLHSCVFTSSLRCIEHMVNSKWFQISTSWTQKNSEHTPAPICWELEPCISGIDFRRLNTSGWNWCTNRTDHENHTSLWKTPLYGNTPRPRIFSYFMKTNRLSEPTINLLLWISICVPIKPRYVITHPLQLWS